MATTRRSPNSPLTGDKFARSLMSPLAATTIAYLLDAGYPADAILRVCINGINGLRNEFAGP